MNFQEAQANSEKNLKTIISKCWEDEAFKQLLISDPVQAIEQLSGKPLDTKGKKLVVTDQTDPSTVYINIPANPDNVELTEADLEAVAGGVEIIILFTVLCVGW